MEPYELFKATRESLSMNKAVIVRGFLDVHRFEFTMEGLEKEFMFLPDLQVEVHDMKQRQKDFSKPFVKTTMKKFVDDIENPHVLRVALDFPLPQLTHVHPFENLDDGLCLGWAQTQGILPVNDQLIRGDVWTVRSWGIAHHAGILTYPHHDAEGACTYAIPLSGVKVWVLASVKHGQVNQEELPEFVANLGNPERRLSEFAAQLDVKIIHLCAGDLIIMPPGQIHSVYTPVASFCRGGHFFNLDTMHLTELSRFVDTTHGKFATNQAHSGTLQTLCRIILALPYLPKTRKLYKRSLIALCGMILHSNAYTAQGEANQESESIKLARKIAKAVLFKFALTTEQKYLDFVSESDMDMFDRGQEVDVHDMLKGLRKHL
ncbi:hypothetical protein L210DRAFT_891763 [Boletus edulis BED1]|uniref:JmjC domain-containing protein n=1 Tax=Boletus edulis BED1 TaxID=1328754 RepID=A0AAD4G6V9_BOLED|nr:hypothetical protein L210DRAFT_891763 [Boletus edulis BED1]